MALRSVWVGGVCNFTLLGKKKKKQAFSSCLFVKKKEEEEEKPTVLHVCVCVPRVCTCVCVSRVCVCVCRRDAARPRKKCAKCAPASITSW